MSPTTSSRRPSRPTRRARRAAERADRRPTPGPGASGPPLALVATILAIVGGLAVVAAISLSQGLGAGAGSASGAPDANPNASLVPPSYTVPGNLGDSPAELGDPSAPIKLELTEDYQCPVCRMFVRQDLPRLVSEFVEPGLVHLTVRDVEFLDVGSSTESLDAATAAACAGEQGRYWEYHDWLYANQHGENEGAFTIARLGAIADAVELDRAAFDACMKAGTERARIQANTNAAVAAGITATPTFVVNGGQPIRGLPTYDSLAAYLRSLVPSGFSPSPSAGG